MTRKSVLENHVRESARLIREYEQILQQSLNPTEKARCRTEIADQRKLIKTYLHEYARLVKGAGATVPADILQIAAASKVAIATSDSPFTTTEPPAGDGSAHPVDPKVQPTPAGALAEPSTAYALVVGVGGYKRMRRLAKTTRDAQDVHDLLVLGGYVRENCFVLIDGEATKGAINDALDLLSRRVQPEDTVLVFFAGHGAQRMGGFEPGEYLCPVEADWYNLRGTAISDQEFTTALRAIRAARLVVFLDACHAGGVGEPRDVIGAVKAGLSDAAYGQMAGKGRVVIASCKPDEVSWEVPEMRNGLFTHYLLDGLRGAAAATDGCVHVFDLFKHLATEVPKHESQHPLFKGELEGDFALTCPRKGATS